MQEIIRLVLFYLSGIWRYRWYALIIAAVISPIGWAYVASLPDQYRSHARVFVDTDSVLTPLLRGLAIQTNESQRVRMMTAVLFGRENMEKLARMTDLDLRAKTPQQMDALVNTLKRRVRLTQTSANIYTISFVDQSPELAKRVVQAMLTIFVESNLGASRRDQDSAERFLTREINDYERRLVESERKLKDFKMRNLDLLSEKGSYYGQLKRAKNDLVRAQDQVALARSRRDEIQQQMDYLESRGPDLPDFRSWLDDSASEVTLPTTKMVQELKAKIDEMLIRYTEMHPEVIAMQRSLERLQAQAAQERAAYIAEQSNNQTAIAKSLASNPLYQEMRLRLADAEAELATQRTRVDVLQAKVETFQAAVDEVMQVESEEQQLNRDYSILKSNHQALLARIEKARLTREVDTNADTVRFRTLDPPKVPGRPAAPKRGMMASSVLGAGVAVGLGFAFLLSQLRPVFYDRRQLNEVVGVPVIGSINLVSSPQRRFKRRLGNAVFLLGVLILLGSYFVVLLSYSAPINLRALIPV